MTKIDLQVLGFTPLETRIYLLLLDNPNLSAKEIQPMAGISLAKTYDCLLNLVQGKPGIGGLIDFRTEGKKRIYYPVDPRTNLQQLREEIISTISTETHKAVEEITERYTLSSKKGICTKFLGLMHYRTRDKALAFIKEVLFTAEELVVIHSLPIWLLKEIRFEINQVARKIATKVFILPVARDDYLLSLFSPHVQVFKLEKELSHPPIYVDGEEWSQGEILIDRVRLVGISYLDADLTLTAFNSPPLVLDKLAQLENMIDRR